jgi:hypothetical protein
MPINLKVYAPAGCSVKSIKEKKSFFRFGCKITYIKNDLPSVEKSFLIPRGKTEKSVEGNQWEFCWL